MNNMPYITWQTEKQSTKPWGSVSSWRKETNEQEPVETSICEIRENQSREQEAEPTGNSSKSLGLSGE